MFCMLGQSKSVLHVSNFFLFEMNMTVPDLEKLIPTIMALVETAENTNIGMDTNVFQDVQTCIMNSLRQVN